MRNPYIFAVSGRKNSGKTTIAVALIKELTERGFKVAAIKHDGHDFEADVPGTDSYQHYQAGAYGTAVFSSQKYLVVKNQPNIKESELISLFPEADFILLEGFKSSCYPKFEIIRKSNSTKSVCRPETMIGVITDLEVKLHGVTAFGLDDIHKIADHLCQISSMS